MLIVRFQENYSGGILQSEMKMGKNLEASLQDLEIIQIQVLFIKKSSCDRAMLLRIERKDNKGDVVNIPPNQFIDILSAIFKLETDRSIWPLIRIYRGGFLLIEFLFLLGINTYGWRQAGVNHVLIFELNPRSNLSHQHLFEVIKGRHKSHKQGLHQLYSWFSGY